ncbi:hypothetical protein ASF58_20830 [Methylobacterium sp. Leaf125]|uniref:uracil-DNA glycosylase family protein n=1 Tax=Methylobacterium sp. Leaf125 TaxID=1736265 RepID=UPI0006FFB021|nr:uracil-DNA glycosylase family protein [Methylobacterium sp. Leaf125]KQQ44619.1 hypothetical protein ASF58_20830 [Methylobacterium sp. Leaf125]
MQGSLHRFPSAGSTSLFAVAANGCLVGLYGRSSGWLALNDDDEGKERPADDVGCFLRGGVYRSCLRLSWLGKVSGRSWTVVIVGLTPGRQQMGNALIPARRSLLNGRTEAEAAEDAKVFASFSGPMRSNLVAMLDSIGLSRSLGIATAGSLWASDAHRVHFTSILRYPVFMNGANYTGAPSPTATPLLRTHLMKWFAEEMRALPNAVFVPLGPVASEAVEIVAAQGRLDRRQVLAGLPHPSGANAERVAFFLGRKRREELSSKVNPEKLLAARAALADKVLALRSLQGDTP